MTTRDFSGEVWRELRSKWDALQSQMLPGFRVEPRKQRASIRLLNRLELAAGLRQAECPTAHFETGPKPYLTLANVPARRWRKTSKTGFGNDAETPKIHRLLGLDRHAIETIRHLATSRPGYVWEKLRLEAGDAKAKPHARAGWEEPRLIDQKLLKPRVALTMGPVCLFDLPNEYTYHLNADIRHMNGARVANQATLNAWIRSQVPPSKADPNLKCRYRMGNGKANPAKEAPILDVEFVGGLIDRCSLLPATIPFYERAPIPAPSWPFRVMPYEWRMESWTPAEIKRADRGTAALRALWTSVLGDWVERFAIVYKYGTEASLAEQISCGGLYKPYCFKYQAADGSLSKVVLDKNPRVKEFIDSSLKKLKRLASRRLVFPIWATFLSPGGWTYSKDYREGSRWCPYPYSALYPRNMELELDAMDCPEFRDHAALYECVFNGRSIVELAALWGITANALGKRLAKAAEAVLELRTWFPVGWHRDIAFNVYREIVPDDVVATTVTRLTKMREIYPEKSRKAISVAKWEAVRGISTPWYRASKAKQAVTFNETVWNTVGAVIDRLLTILPGTS
jgi:hypothetical protein